MLSPEILKKIQKCPKCSHEGELTLGITETADWSASIYEDRLGRTKDYNSDTETPMIYCGECGVGSPLRAILTEEEYDELIEAFWDGR